MSLLKNILKPFVDFNAGDENEDAEQEGKLPQKEMAKDNVSTSVNAAVNTGNTTTTTNASYKPSQATSSAKSAAINDYHQYFENLIEEANAKNPMFQGTDFKEFIDSKIDVE